MLSGDYEAEQAELLERSETLTAEIEQQEEQVDNIDKFIAKVKKYLEMTELTPAILNDLVRRYTSTSLSKSMESGWWT